MKIKLLSPEKTTPPFLFRQEFQKYFQQAPRLFILVLASIIVQILIYFAISLKIGLAVDYAIYAFSSGLSFLIIYENVLILTVLFFILNLVSKLIPIFLTILNEKSYNGKSDLLFTNYFFKQIHGILVILAVGLVLMTLLWWFFPLLLISLIPGFYLKRYYSNFEGKILKEKSRLLSKRGIFLSLFSSFAETLIVPFVFLRLTIMPLLGIMSLGTYVFYSILLVFLATSIHKTFNDIV